MSKSPRSKGKGKSKESSGGGGGSKELQKKIEELELSISSLRAENDELKSKLKLICKKIVDNTNMANYSFLDASSLEQPETIDLKDIMHMLQTIILLANELPEANLENHVEKLEMRITELSNENSSYFKHKLKLQERLEFIMQERDVWKRNADTLKKMYAKLVKEQEKSNIAARSNTIDRCFIGTYQGNIDPKNPNWRTFSAPIPRDYFDNLRTKNVTDVQLNAIDQLISNQLATLPSANSTPRSAESITTTPQIGQDNFVSSAPSTPIPSVTQPHLQPNYNNDSFNDSGVLQSGLIEPLNDSTNSNIVHSLLSRKRHQSAHHNLPSRVNSAASSSLQSYSTIMSEFNNELDLSQNVVDRLITSRKNVTFNNDIDVRIFNKNAKNSKNVMDSYVLPLQPQQVYDGMRSTQNDPAAKDKLAGGDTTSISYLTKSNQLKDINSILEQMNNSNKQKLTGNGSNSIAGGGSLPSDPRLSASQLNLNNIISSSSNYLYESKFANRANICSNKKLPGETCVKDLEPTLKMIIIKELSAEKLDGNDWRMFARRIEMNENDIHEWEALRLQYPMARVISFWSSRPEATVRLLHRHLNALNYGILSKRIENFYDVF